MSELMGATCFGDGRVEEASEKEIFPTTISTREMRGKLLMQYLVPHCWSQVTGVSTETEPTNHLPALITYKILQFLFVNPTTRVIQNITQRTCHNGFHV